LKENTQNLISKRSLFGVSREELTKSWGIALAIVIFVTTFFRVAIVDGESMEPTLYAGDVVLVSRMSPIHRNDVVIVRHDHAYVVKRAIGIPGDDMPGGKLEKGEYYIAGDNRQHSYDSREYGPVTKMRGKVICRILPNPMKDLSPRIIYDKK